DVARAGTRRDKSRPFVDPVQCDMLSHMTVLNATFFWRISMRLSHLIVVGIVGLGLAMTPVFTPTLRGEDTPKEKPRGERGERGQFLERYRAVIDKLNPTSEQKPKIDAAFAEAKTKIADV